MADDGEGDLLEICLKSGMVLSIQSVTFSLVPVVLYCLQAFSFSPTVFFLLDSTFLLCKFFSVELVVCKRTRVFLPSRGP